LRSIKTLGVVRKFSLRALNRPGHNKNSDIAVELINPQLKKHLTTGNLLNALLIIAVVVLLFVPSAKAFLLRGLMKTGLFQPEVSYASKPVQVPDINFRDANGETVSLSSLKGKVVFINFWATWCPPCLAEMPAINTLHQKLTGNKNIVFLMADADGKPELASLFLQNKQYNLPVYAAITAVPANVSGGTIPTTVVLNKKGEMVYHHEGVADYTNDKFAVYLQQLSAE
jgi:thiol-disulfide isomerase/thioredoxin